MADEVKLHSPIHSTFEVLVSNMRSGVVLQKNRAHSVDLLIVGAGIAVFGVSH